ncbi:hypothetical protein [Streptomyces sp. NPDC017940]|uniref:hypothetical protein n=1 Tax=Streptomyces sp. NPDC017940 TaxID=3365017 RepID=UPI0037943F6E
MGRETPGDREAAHTIGVAAERDPQRATGVPGFDERADAAAQRNKPDNYDYNSRVGPCA